MASNTSLNALGHDIHRLRMAVEDPEGIAKMLRPVAKKYGDAYHDSEVQEVLSMCDKGVHVTSLWGVTRGLDAFAVMMSQEKQAMQIMWNTRFRPITPTVFVREGTVVMLMSNRKDSIFKGLWSKPKVEEIKEHIVIDPETRKITYRSLALGWGVAVY